MCKRKQKDENTMELNALLMHFNHDRPDIIEITDFDKEQQQFTIILDREGTVRLLTEILTAMQSEDQPPEGAENFSGSFYYLMNHLAETYGPESIGSFVAGLEHSIILMQESVNDVEDISTNDCTIIINEYGAKAVDIQE